MKSKLFIASELVLLIMIFAIQNAATVDIRLLSWDTTFPRSLRIFLMVLIGVVIACRVSDKLSVKAGYMTQFIWVDNGDSRMNELGLLNFKMRA